MFWLFCGISHVSEQTRLAAFCFENLLWFLLISLTLNLQPADCYPSIALHEACKQRRQLAWLATYKDSRTVPVLSRNILKQPLTSLHLGINKSHKMNEPYSCCMAGIAAFPALYAKKTMSQLWLVILEVNKHQIKLFLWSTVQLLYLYILKNTSCSHILICGIQGIFHMHRLLYNTGAPQAFHIPLTDHGCKCTQVQNGTKSFLWLPQQKKKKKKFSREATDQQAPAGPHLECVVALYRFSLFYCFNAQLMGVTGLTLQGAAFRCVSQCSEIWWEM